MPRTDRSPWLLASAGAVLRLVAALFGAPVILAFVLTMGVLAVSSVTGDGARATLDEVGSAALVFSQSLIVFSLTFGAAGVLLLVITGQRGAAVWITAGLLLGVASDMVHGILTSGQVRDAEMALAGLLGAALFLLIRRFARIG